MGRCLAWAMGKDTTTDSSRNMFERGKLDLFLVSSSGLCRYPIPDVCTVALALREQLVEDVPVTEHDWKMDMIVTPDKTIQT
jgi:5-formyltetrahydrofolate cyclo-ligase